MHLSDYISLLVSLKSTSLTIWGFLLTVSLGIVAFVGSAQKVKMKTYMFLSLLFICFAASNRFALERNFTAREEIRDKIYSCEKYKKFESLSGTDKAALPKKTVCEEYEVNNLIFRSLAPREELKELFGLSAKEANIRFQEIVSVFVLVILVLNMLQANKNK